VGKSNSASRFLEELPEELIQQEVGKEASGFSVSRGPEWSDHFWQDDRPVDFHDPEPPVPADNAIVLIPEGFMPLRIGMRVRHARFGEGRVRAVEGMDENQKATIFFQTAGDRRVKVRDARLEILE
jgi:DNA helicase-2/ATP-dependent DNA helicase PcrA